MSFLLYPLIWLVFHFVDPWFEMPLTFFVASLLAVFHALSRAIGLSARHPPAGAILRAWLPPAVGLLILWSFTGFSEWSYAPRVAMEASLLTATLGVLLSTKLGPVRARLWGLLTLVLWVVPEFTPFPVFGPLGVMALIPFDRTCTPTTTVLLAHLELVLWAIVILFALWPGWRTLLILVLSGVQILFFLWQHDLAPTFLAGAFWVWALGRPRDTPFLCLVVVALGLILSGWVVTAELPSGYLVILAFLPVCRKARESWSSKL